MILAVGGGVSVYYAQSYGEQTITRPAPEAVLYAYFPVGYNLLLRPGIRINFSWDSSESPQALKVKETDFRYYGELGLVYNWIVLPSFSVGLGFDQHTIKFSTKPPIYVFHDQISSTENDPSLYFQIGVGFPLIRGWLVIEPYARYTIVQHVVTSGLGYGIEATLEIL